MTILFILLLILLALARVPLFAVLFFATLLVYSEEVLTELLHYRDLHQTSSTP